jgi:hypothetical protein
MKDDFSNRESEAELQSTWIARTGGYARDMTLHDHFAGLAMQAMFGDHVRNFDLLAIEAYQMADAMLAEREGK